MQTLLKRRRRLTLRRLPRIKLRRLRLLSKRSNTDMHIHAQLGKLERLSKEIFGWQRRFWSRARRRTQAISAAILAAFDNEAMVQKIPALFRKLVLRTALTRRA